MSYRKDSIFKIALYLIKLFGVYWKDNFTETDQKKMWSFIMP